MLQIELPIDPDLKFVRPEACEEQRADVFYQKVMLSGVTNRKFVLLFEFKAEMRERIQHARKVVNTPVLDTGEFSRKTVAVDRNLGRRRPGNCE